MQNARLDKSQAGIKMLGEISTASDMQMPPARGVGTRALGVLAEGPGTGAWR